MVLIKKEDVRDGEIAFLKYIIRCCENVLEDSDMLEQYNAFDIPMLQLIKMRAEVTFRLAQKWDIKYGKFSTNDHLLSGKKDNFDEDVSKRKERGKIYKKALDSFRKSKGDKC